MHNADQYNKLNYITVRQYLQKKSHTTEKLVWIRARRNFKKEAYIWDHDRRYETFKE